MNPFNDQPHAWPETIITIACIAVICYAGYIVWPAVSLLWLVLTW